MKFPMLCGIVKSAIIGNNDIAALHYFRKLIHRI